MLDLFVQKVLPAAIGSAFSIMCAWLLVLWNRRKYGGWRALLKEDGVLLGQADLGWTTAKQWLTDPWAKKLGLKSLCADYNKRLSTNVLDITAINPADRTFVVEISSARGVS